MTNTLPVKSITKSVICSLLLAAVSLAPAWANDDKTQKNQYNLFNPTPRSLMRELVTDRPDKTEAPYTVDAGHFQIETDIMIQSREKTVDAGTTTETISNNFFLSNLKVGLTNSIDLQVLVAPVVKSEEKIGGVTSSDISGVGDTTVRLKMNLIGNDGGDFAIGLMPFVKIPTAKTGLGNDKVEGGIIAPFGLSLPNDWSMGWMFQLNFFKNAGNDRLHPEFISSITFGHDLIGDLGGYAELFSESSQDVGAEWVATFDAGFTYGLTADIQLDAGANIGLTSAADDLNPFVGISARF